MLSVVIKVIKNVFKYKFTLVTYFVDQDLPFNRSLPLTLFAQFFFNTHSAIQELKLTMTPATQLFLINIIRLLNVIFFT